MKKAETMYELVFFLAVIFYGHASANCRLGRGILVGLEFLTVIVLIRTFLSMTLSMEVNAWLPWKKKRRI